MIQKKTGAPQPTALLRGFCCCLNSAYYTEVTENRSKFKVAGVDSLAPSCRLTVRIEQKIKQTSSTIPSRPDERASNLTF